MESQPQNAELQIKTIEFWNNPENFHQCTKSIGTQNLVPI